MNIFKRINFHIINWTITAAETDSDVIDFAVGGQAVIEGVMMRAPSNITIAVRKTDGSIKVRVKKYKTLTQRFSWLNLPILRGVINLFEMMAVGTEAINFSANESLEEFDEEKDKDKKPSKLGKILEVLMFIFSIVIALGISLFLFKVLPLSLTTYLDGQFQPIHDNFMLFNFIDGLIKMSVFLSYIFILSRFKSFRRIFEYHGAEHKSIRNYESKKPLTTINARQESRFHPRCGTSFILIVFVISIIFYTFVPKQDDFLTNLLLRIAVLPFIAGISYEYLKFSAKHSDNTLVQAMIAPGLWFQRLTTQEPNDKQLEVGLKSLQDSVRASRDHAGTEEKK